MASEGFGWKFSINSAFDRTVVFQVWINDSNNDSLQFIRNLKYICLKIILSNSSFEVPYALLGGNFCGYPRYQE